MKKIMSVLLFAQISVSCFVSCSEREEGGDDLQSAMRKASEGRASELTPNELKALREHNTARADANRRQIESRVEKARSKFSEKEIAIHSFMNKRWTILSESPSGYDPDVHDKLVATEAAKKFGLTEKEAKDIYTKVDLAGLGFK